MGLVRKHIGLLVGLVLITLALYPTLNNGMLFWDDHAYILENELAHSLSTDNIKNAFSTSSVNSNYHPLTHLSWAVDYSINGKGPGLFHLHNLLLHLLNSILVYLFIFLLSKNTKIATVAIILFGLHPMHVESVAWISARKDLLYSFYFLLAMIVYSLRYRGNRKAIYYLTGAYLCFLLSLLSKGMAITLPLILLAIDYYHHQKDWKKLVLEKIPFIITALFFAYIGYLGQGEGQALNDLEEVSFIKRIFVASYGVVFYIIKLFIPEGLSAFHPYPAGDLPWYFYVSIVPVLLLIYGIFKGIRKNRTMSFGVLFFLISIAPVIQLVPFGLAVVAERYTYLPYVGLIFVLAFWWEKLLKQTQRKPIIYVTSCLYVIGLGTISFQQSHIWKNDKTLWTQVIEEYPDHYFAYANVADYCLEYGNNDCALEHYNKTIERENRYYLAYNNRGLIHQSNGNLDLALSDFEKAIELGNYTKAYINAGVIYYNNNQDSLALLAFNEAIKHDSTYALAWFNLGNIHFRSGQYEKALQDFNKAESMGYQHYNFLIIRSKAHLQLGNVEDAFNDLQNQTVKYPKPNSYIEFGWFYHQRKEYQNAIQQYNFALLEGPNRNAFVNRGLAYYLINDYSSALNDYNAALEMDSNFYPTYHNRALVYQALNDTTQALQDFNQALKYSNSLPNIVKDKTKLLIAIEDFESALTSINSITDNQKDGESYFLRSKIHEALGNAKLSLNDIDQSKKLGYVLQ